MYHKHIKIIMINKIFIINMIPIDIDHTYYLMLTIDKNSTNYEIIRYLNIEIQ